MFLDQFIASFDTPPRHLTFDLDAVTAVVGDGAAEEADRGGRFLVGEHLDVGEPAVVVDADVDVLPADRLSLDA